MYSYLARQPILNKDKVTIGYELLFRDGPENSFPNICDEEATNRLLIDNFFSSGSNQVTGGKRGFVNFPHASLIQRVPLMFPKQSFIIEILESCEPNDELLEAIIELNQKGYTLALDDFNPSPEWNRFIPYIHIIKFDIRQTPIEKCALFIRRHKIGKLKFLAEKVENHEEFMAAYDAGFDFFQGYFFSKPEMMQRRSLTPSGLTTIRLYQEICQPEVDYNKVEEIIATDVSLSYKLLRHVNGMLITRAKPISSFKQALVYLGEEKLRRFITFVAASHALENKPQSLYNLSLQRAQFCERLVPKASIKVCGNQAFLTGLFSLLDSLLDQPLEELLRLLPLSDDIKSALIEQKGPLGILLKLAVAYDKADWDVVARCTTALKLNESDVVDAYMQSVKWATAFERTMTKNDV
ncbi:histidine kinase [Photobacterium jeanii]|uniref:Histidine kinase n=1 Tax=Photobacterium jeanii TaxID=858640 RepID=A0A178KM46_9GAMM|nr:HDOD domain-containing protein [Photobacterium jeanii]OAN18458.1 histidine kinase [Photobacterium jeanii]PST91861.1 HDOD domain-containing protein [Photobacterium jeanii]